MVPPKQRVIFRRPFLAAIPGHLFRLRLQPQRAGFCKMIQIMKTEATIVTDDCASISSAAGLADRKTTRRNHF